MSTDHACHDQQVVVGHTQQCHWQKLWSGAGSLQNHTLVTFVPYNAYKDDLGNKPTSFNHVHGTLHNVSLRMRSLEHVSVFLEACFRIRSIKARIQDCSMVH